MDRAERLEARALLSRGSGASGAETRGGLSPARDHRRFARCWLLLRGFTRWWSFGTCRVEHSKTTCCTWPATPTDAPQDLWLRPLGRPILRQRLLAVPTSTDSAGPVQSGRESRLGAYFAQRTSGAGGAAPSGESCFWLESAQGFGGANSPHRPPAGSMPPTVRPDRAARRRRRARARSRAAAPSVDVRAAIPLHRRAPTPARRCAQQNLAAAWLAGQMWGDGREIRAREARGTRPSRWRGVEGGPARTTLRTEPEGVALRRASGGRLTLFDRSQARAPWDPQH